ncbi:MAG: C-GCAxxG-C-C family protein [Burkholderiaceae bacterium]|nr:C-GCAxxG-C-C family protein [Burkholderiaceae bacterium]
MVKAKEIEAGQVAEELFLSGLNCAESALLALAKMQGSESSVMPGIATCFGGGMARTGGACGALTGALMGLGLALGRKKAGDPILVVQEATQRLIREFEQSFGARDCHILLGYAPNGPDGNQAFSKEGRRERCAMMTRKCTEFAARIVLESQAAKQEN